MQLMKILKTSYLLFFVFAAMASLPAVKRNTASPSDDTSYLRSVLDFGKSRGWSTAVQDRLFNNYMAAHPGPAGDNIVAVISKANTASAKFFALKSLLGGDVLPTVQHFIGELNQYPENYQQQQCLVFNAQGMVQKWQYSCSIAVVLTLMGDICPRYAWDMKKVPGWDKVMNDPNNPMAQQEKGLLEQYGGIASARGDASGKSIGIVDVINGLAGRVTGMSFYAQAVPASLPQALSNVKALLDAGMDVPAMVDFLPSHTPHFILFFRDKF
jgi:hypothetical protein